jgi:hypothetical protein
MEGAMKHRPEQIEDLQALVARLQREQGKTPDAVFCGRHRKFVGTTRTWRDRLCAGDFTQVDVPAKTAALRELITFLEGGDIPERLYEDLPFNLGFQNGVALLEGQQATDRRIFCVLGGIGVGKTVSTVLALREGLREGYRGPKRRMLIISEALRENKIGLLSTIAAVLNCPPEIGGAAALMNFIKGALSAEDYTLFFDEAHQGGVMLMRLLKDLVNHTKGRFVYVALRTEYARVVGATRGNIVEAKQFMRRCMAPVFDSHSEGTLATLRRRGQDADGDVVVFLRRAGLKQEEARRLAVEKLSVLRAYGNLSSLHDAIDFARLDCEESGDPFTAAKVAEAISTLCPTGNQ